MLFVAYHCSCLVEKTWVSLLFAARFRPAAGLHPDQEGCPQVSRVGSLGSQSLN